MKTKEKQIEQKRDTVTETVLEHLAKKELFHNIQARAKAFSLTWQKEKNEEIIIPYLKDAFEAGVKQERMKWEQNFAKLKEKVWEFHRCGEFHLHNPDSCKGINVPVIEWELVEKLFAQAHAMKFGAIKAISKNKIGAK